MVLIGGVVVSLFNRPVEKKLKRMLTRKGKAVE